MRRLAALGANEQVLYSFTPRKLYLIKDGFLGFGI
jgi:hypothetical protein